MRMKKLLAATLAAALTLSLSAAAFADNNSVVGAVVDGDGEAIKTGNGMASGTPSFTLSTDEGAGDFDVIMPDQTIYLGLGAYSSTNWESDDYIKVGGYEIPSSYLANSDLFKLTVKDKSGDASKLIKITQEDSKTLDGYDRGSWLKVVIGNTMTADELKGTMTLHFAPKASKIVEKLQKNAATVNTKFSTSYNDDSSDADYDDDWDTVEDAIGDADDFEIELTFWVNNDIEDGEDADRDTGDAFVFNPTSNEENTIIWNTSDGERASLKFEADDDADKFYAKLSTKSISSLWSEYADPIGADLWFYDFVGATTIPATSRATLTLGIPWDEDDDYAPSPEDCFIYRLNSDGTLEDVTNNFTYDEDGDIDGWYTRTRELGTFVVSDMELDIEVAGAVDEVVDEDVIDNTTTDKAIPNTGSGDAVNVAVAAGVVSLAVASAVAFRKSAY